MVHALKGLSPKFTKQYLTQAWTTTKARVRQLSHRQHSASNQKWNKPLKDYRSTSAFMTNQASTVATDIAHGDIQDAPQEEPESQEASLSNMSSASSFTPVARKEGSIPPLQPLVLELEIDPPDQSFASHFADFLSSDSEPQSGAASDQFTSTGLVRRQLSGLHSLNGIRHSAYAAHAIETWHQQQAQQQEWAGGSSLDDNIQTVMSGAIRNEEQDLCARPAGSDGTTDSLQYQNGALGWSAHSSSTKEYPRSHLRHSSSFAGPSTPIYTDAYSIVPSRRNGSIFSNVRGSVSPEEYQQIVNKYAGLCENSLSQYDSIIRTQDEQVKRIFSLYRDAFENNDKPSLVEKERPSGSADASTSNRPTTHDTCNPPIAGGGPLSSHPIDQNVTEFPVTPPRSSRRNATSELEGDTPQQDSGYHSGCMTTGSSGESASEAESLLASKGVQESNSDNKRMSYITVDSSFEREPETAQELSCSRPSIIDTCRRSQSSG